MILAIGCTGVLQFAGDKLKKANVEVRMEEIVATPTQIAFDVDISVDAANSESLSGVYYMLEQDPALGASDYALQAANTEWRYTSLGSPIAEGEGTDNAGKPVKKFTYTILVSGVTMTDNTQYRLWVKAVNVKGKISQTPGYQDFETDFTGPDITFTGHINGSNQVYLDWSLVDSDSGVASSTMTIVPEDFDGAGSFSAPGAALALTTGNTGSVFDPAMDALLVTQPHALRRYTLSVADNLGNVGTLPIFYPDQSISSIAADVNAAPVGVAPLSFKTNETLTVTFRGKSFGAAPTLLVREGLDLVEVQDATSVPLTQPLALQSAVDNAGEREVTFEFKVPHTYFQQRLIDNCSGATCPASVLLATLGFTLKRAEDDQEIDYTATAVELNLDDTYDGDGDGVSDVYEIMIHGTDPNDPSPQLSKANSTIEIDCGLPAAKAGTASAAQVYRSGTTTRTCAVHMMARNQNNVLMYNPYTLAGTFPNGQVTLSLGGGGAVGTLTQPVANNSTGTLTVASGVTTELINSITASWASGSMTNTLSSAAPTVTVRVTPTCTITSVNPVEGAWRRNATENISFVCNTANPLYVHDLDAVDPIKCNKDAGGWNGCTSSHIWNPVTEGDHTIQVAVFDIDGQLGTAVSRSWRTDLTAPIATMATKPTNPSADLTPDFTFTYADTGGTNNSALDSYECEVDGAGASFFDCTTPFSTALAAGSHTMKVRARDVAGNVGPIETWTWTIDASGATCTITSVNPPAASWRKNSSETITYSCTDPAGVPNGNYECELIGLSTVSVPCDSTNSVNLSLSSESYTFRVRATDGLGLTGAWVSRAWGTDLVAPAAPTWPSAQAAFTGASPSFTWNDSTDTGGSPAVTYLCAVDNAAIGAATACTKPHGPGPLADGPHTIYVWARDSALNDSAVSLSHAWTVDTAPPTSPTIDSVTPSAMPTSSSTVSIAFSGGTDAGSGVAGYQCQWAGGGWNSCTSPYVENSLTTGSYLFEVRTIDVGGTPSVAVNTTVVVDRSGPNPPSTIAMAATYYNPTGAASVVFTWSGASDVGAGSIASYECNWNGGGWSACVSGTTSFSTASITAGNSGLIGLQVRAIDNVTPAANTGAASATYNLQVDKVGPTAPTSLVMTSPYTNPTSDASVIFGWTASTETGYGAVASYECSWNGGGYAACVSGTTSFSTASITAGNSGTIVLNVRAKDNIQPVANNGSVGTITLQVDKVGPNAVTALTAVPATATAAATVSFTWTASSGDVGYGSLNGYQCSYDGGAYAPCTSGVSFSSGATGTRVFNIRAYDNVGQTNNYTQSTTNAIIDKTGPNAPTGITPSPAAPTAAGSVIFSWTAPSDVGASGVNASGYQCNWNSGGWSACTSGVTSFSTASVASGAYGAINFQVRANDNLGNAGTAASYNYNVDKQGPTVTLTGYPANGGNTGAFSWSVADNGYSSVANTYCRLDGAGFGVCNSGSVNYGTLNGAHTFQIYSVDALGNTGSTVTYSWTGCSPTNAVMSGWDEGSCSGIGGTYTRTRSVITPASCGGSTGATSDGPYACSCASWTSATSTSWTNPGPRTSIVALVIGGGGGGGGGGTGGSHRSGGGGGGTGGWNVYNPSVGVGANVGVVVGSGGGGGGSATGGGNGNNSSFAGQAAAGGTGGGAGAGGANGIAGGSGGSGTANGGVGGAGSSSGNGGTGGGTGGGGGGALGNQGGGTIYRGGGGGGGGLAGSYGGGSGGAGANGCSTSGCSGLTGSGGGAGAGGGGGSGGSSAGTGGSGGAGGAGSVYICY